MLAKDGWNRLLSTQNASSRSVFEELSHHLAGERRAFPWVASPHTRSSGMHARALQWASLTLRGPFLQGTALCRSIDVPETGHGVVAGLLRIPVQKIRFHYASKGSGQLRVTAIKA